MTERLVTVSLIHGGQLTIPCPDWCTGHPAAWRPEYPEDINHETQDVDLIVTAGGSDYDVLGYGLAQAPYSQRSPLPRATVILGEHGFVEMTPDEIRGLADALERHAVALRSFADEAEQFIAEASADMRPDSMPTHLPWPPVRDGGEQP